MPNSYKPEVLTAGGNDWTGNSLRFATHDEADKYAVDLMCRWTAVRETRVVESDDPVNYRWSDISGLSSLEDKAA